MNDTNTAALESLRDMAYKIWNELPQFHPAVEAAYETYRKISEQLDLVGPNVSGVSVGQR